MNPYVVSLLIALGSAIGGVGRFWMSLLIDERLGSRMLGTLSVNVLGCLLIGVIYGLSDKEWIKHLVVIGILGGFTTFSSFGLQTFKLIQEGDPLKAGGYVVASVALCLVAVWLGYLITRPFANPL